MAANRIALQSGTGFITLQSGTGVVLLQSDGVVPTEYTARTQQPHQARTAQWAAPLPIYTDADTPSTQVIASEDPTGSPPTDHDSQQPTQVAKRWAEQQPLWPGEGTAQVFSDPTVEVEAPWWSQWQQFRSNSPDTGRASQFFACGHRE